MQTVNLPGCDSIISGIIFTIEVALSNKYSTVHCTQQRRLASKSQTVSTDCLELLAETLDLYQRMVSSRCY